MEAPWLRRTLIALAVAHVGIVVLLPFISVFAQALSHGFATYGQALADPAGRSAIGLTLLVAAIAVPLNTFFGVWLAIGLARTRLRCRKFLITLLDLPFSVSPVVAGLLFVLLFGRNGWCGPWLEARGFHIIFAVPGLVLATLFVTLPFVARELIPLLEAQGRDEEEAAALLGASRLRVFWKVTLPNIKWALLYGVILCNARAMGEFGAVSVVSGHIRGRTNTLPLHVEVLFNDYNFVAASAMASLLALLGLATLVVRAVAERQTSSRSQESGVRSQGSERHSPPMTNDH
ncbi:MAG: sulfate ABC transporter permease subunit CysW [Kiritimatiellia bacterium]